MKVEEFVLSIIRKKKTVTSSYFFYNLLTRIGYVGSVDELIESLKEKGLIEHEGFFYTSSISKNITLTPKGDLYLSSLSNEEVISDKEPFVSSHTLWEGLKEQWA